MPLPGAASQPIHPQLRLHLGERFLQSGQVQQKQTIRNSASGSTTYQWTARPGMETLACRRWDGLPQENRTVGIVEAVEMFTFLLNGYYPSILETDRFVQLDTNEVFDIVGIDSDSASLYTRLTCRRIKPVAEPGV